MSSFDTNIHSRIAKNKQFLLQSLLRQKQVKALVHFTRVENLASILEHGLLSRAAAEERDLELLISDHMRLDKHLNGISTSVSFPNSKMFYRKRMENPNTEWAVLLINPAVVWKSPCAFYKNNAASAGMSSLPISSLQNPECFSAMFENKKERQQQNLFDFDTTDVQAEVMVFDSISPNDIEKVVFSNQRTANSYYKLIKATDSYIDVGVNDYGFFNQREFVRRTPLQYA